MPIARFGPKAALGNRFSHGEDRQPSFLTIKSASCTSSGQRRLAAAVRRSLVAGVPLVARGVLCTLPSFGYGSGPVEGGPALFTRRRIATMAGLIASFAPAATLAVAQPAETVMTCTNPASGATWQIRINLGRSTVDANAARISDTAISWHDAKDGGNYTLDRRSGKLTVVVASSTGGYFLYDRCAVAKAD